MRVVIQRVRSASVEIEGAIHSRIDGGLLVLVGIEDTDTSEDVDWLVPHQANLRIIDATAERMGLPKEKVMINIQKYGNTTAGTLPLCLWDWEKQLKKGDNLILSAFGGGFTWGAVYLKWAYNS